MSRGKETAVKRFLAGMVDGGEDGGPVVRPERTDFRAGTIAQHFVAGIFGCFGHCSSPCIGRRSIRMRKRRRRASLDLTAGRERFRMAKPDTARIQRAMAERNGRIAMR